MISMSALSETIKKLDSFIHKNIDDRVINGVCDKHSVNYSDVKMVNSITHHLINNGFMMFGEKGSGNKFFVNLLRELNLDGLNLSAINAASSELFAIGRTNRV